MNDVPRSPGARNSLAEKLRADPDSLSDRAAYRLSMDCGLLAPFLLEASVLRRASAFAVREVDEKLAQILDPASPPQLPTGKGSCWIVFVDSEGRDSLPCVRKPFLLPLCWKEEPDHDERLPAELLKFADDVLALLREHNKSERLKSNWSLHLTGDPSLQPPYAPDLRDLRLTCGSGFASLAGGLLVAALGGIPSHKVWASAEWRNGTGICPVEGLRAKYKLAETMNVEEFFVAEEQEDTEGLDKNGGPKIKKFKRHPTNPMHALAAYRLRLFVRPTSEDSLSVRQAYYAEVLDADKRQRPGFYLETLAEEAGIECRRKLGDTLQHNVTHLVTCISRSPELAVLAAKTFRPTQKVLLIYTNDDDEIVKSLETVNAELKKRGFDPQPISVENGVERVDKLVDELTEKLRDALSDVDPRGVVVDLTAGLRLMLVALLDALPADALAVVLQAKTDPNTKSPIPATEVPVSWRIGPKLNDLKVHSNSHLPDDQAVAD